MRRYRLTWLAAAVLLAAVAGSARADSGVAVLGIEPVDVPEQLAQALTDALRQRASSTGGLKVIPGKDLVEMKMIFGCDGESPACMAQAGRSLGADKLLYGTLKKAGKSSNNVVVALKLLDITTATVEKFVNESVPKRELAAGNVNGAAAKWFAALVEVEAKPTLNITSEPTNAAVAIDGQAAGRTPVTLRDLSPGSHTAAISMSGRVTALRTIELRPGGTHELNVMLEAEAGPVAKKEPVAPPPAPEPLVLAQPRVEPAPQSVGHPGRTAKVLAIAAFAGAVVAGGVAIYTWRTYRDLEDTSHADLVGLKPMSGATQDQVNFFKNPSCSPKAGVLSGSGAQKFTNDCSSGQTYADATTALWVVAGALATAGVISYVVGDRQAAHAREKQSAARLIRQSLRIAPVLTTRSGGLQAAFEF